jgi:hypothetical protein
MTDRQKRLVEIMDQGSWSCCSITVTELLDVSHGWRAARSSSTDRSAT